VERDKVLARARNNAYALLRQRPRSESEIVKRLLLKGYAREKVESVVGELKKLGYIDDAKFAREWVESRMRANPKGDAVLRQELRGKGVADDLIDDALTQKAQRYDDSQIALSMAREQFERFKKLDRRKAAKRVYDFLARRGFGYGTIQGIIEELTRN
jgi:regulatory protein